MNALDQAFIKAFAKDRTVTAESKGEGSSRTSERFQPPAENTESTPLVLREADQRDQRWRLDRPLANDVTLDSHLKFPVVDSLEADDTSDKGDMAARSVTIEDHCRCVDPTPDLIQPVEFMDVGPPAGVVEDKPASDMGTDVEPRGEANAERDVPTLGIPADRSVAELEGAAEPEHGEATESPDEERVQPLPEVFWVAMELEMPELMTHEFSGLDRASAWRLHAGTSSAEISESGVDLEVGPVRTGDGCPAEDGESDSERACPEAEKGQQAWLERVESAGESDVPAPDQCPVAASEGWSESALMASDGGRGSGETECGSEEAAAKSDAELHVFEPPSRGPFAAAWEVDAFRWPELCWQLDEQTGARLEQAGRELFAATRDGLNVLAVTSSSRLEGRTTAALALARSAMLAGASVAVVDADFGNPELARRVGMDAPCDWCEVVGRGECLSEAAVTSLGDRVTLVPKKFGEACESGGPLELLLSMLSDLARYFDLVVVDLPPAFSEGTVLGEAAVQAVGKTLTSCPIDMAVVVRNVRETPRDQCMATVSSLRGLGVQAVGVIENYTQPSDVTVCHRTRLAVQPSDSRCQA
ncbi:MAG: hypothetical protein ACQESR_28645 [Planctomycetota bacterium]